MRNALDSASLAAAPGSVLERGDGAVFAAGPARAAASGRVGRALERSRMAATGRVGDSGLALMVAAGPGWGGGVDTGSRVWLSVDVVGTKE